MYIHIHIYIYIYVYVCMYVYIYDTKEDTDANGMMSALYKILDNLRSLTLSISVRSLSPTF